MKTSRWICVFTFIALILFVWWYRRSTSVGEKRNHPALADGINRTNRVEVSKSTSSTPTKSKITEQLKKEFTTLNDRPIEFYGKAVDQYGDPVADAEVIGNVLVFNGKKEGVEQVRTKTDATGCFQVIGYSGESLEIGVRKVPGFYNGRVDGEMTQGFLARYSIMYKEVHHPDLNKPVIFKMWRLQGPEPMIEGKDFYGIVPDGRQYTIDLINTKKIEGGSKGDFIVQILRPGILGTQSKHDWSFEIKAIDGGLIETEDPFPYLAPEAGYQLTCLYSMSTSDPNWSDRVKKQFYMKSRGGKVYARVQVEILENYQKESALRIYYLANPSGSRNLEWDPKERMTKDDINKLGY